MPAPSPAPRRSARDLMPNIAWLVHLYTAAGAVLAFLATTAILADDYRHAFLYLFWAVIVDGSDGWLARRARVSERVPRIDGRTLDDVVDYATFVFVPVVLLWRAHLVPDSISVVVLSGVLTASSFGFAHTDAKTSDHFFTGFPSYWNIVAFYLYAGSLRPVWNTAILCVLSMLVFVPIRYVYPSRTPTLLKVTVALCTVWGAGLLWMISILPTVSRRWLGLSLAFPVYYTVLSLILSRRPRRP